MNKPANNQNSPNTSTNRNVNGKIPPVVTNQAAKKLPVHHVEPVKPSENATFIDQLTGSNAGLNYFVIWSKYYYYVYDKKGRVIKGEKCATPLIQIEIIENKSIEMYGIELEIVSRAEDCRDDEEKERDNLILEYKFVLDHFKLPAHSKAAKRDDKKNSNTHLTEVDILKMYHSSCSTSIEIHSCMVLTKNKKKLFACTEIGKLISTTFLLQKNFYYKKSFNKKIY